MWVKVESSGGTNFVVNTNHIAYITDGEYDGGVMLYMTDGSFIRAPQTVDEWIEMLNTGDFNG